MTHASLFSGIGGPEIAAAMLGWENLFHCEINPFGRTVLEYWFPESKSYEDITRTDFKEWRGRVDVLTGGFPCQPFSYAGKRGGRNDDRYLWPEMLRAIEEIRPAWVVGENVAGITTMVEAGNVSEMGCEASIFPEGDDIYRYEHVSTFTVERICRDLERIGYSVQPVLIPAAAVGAPHRRDRIFFLAHADTDCSNDVRGTGENEETCGAERIQKRDEVRIAGEPGDVRPEIFGAVEDTLRDGRRFGQSEIERSNGKFRNTCPGDSERLCGEERVDSSYAYCRRGNEIHQHIQSGISDGAESFSNGGKRASSDPFRERLATAMQSGCYGSQEWHDEGRPAGMYSDDAWIKGTWWDNFPTVSPVHTRDDGISKIMDGTPLRFNKWRNESIKAYGNAIVPQVMYRIFQAIEVSDNYLSLHTQ